MSGKIVSHIKDTFIAAAVAIPLGTGIYWAAENTNFDYQERYPSLSQEDAQALRTDTAKYAGTTYGILSFLCLVAGFRAANKSKHRSPKP